MYVVHLIAATSIKLIISSSSLQALTLTKIISNTPLGLAPAQGIYKAQYSNLTIAKGLTMVRLKAVA